MDVKKEEEKKEEKEKEKVALEGEAEEAGKGVLRTGDRSIVRFRFIQHPEYLKLGSRLLFREGRTKGVGKIVRLISESESLSGTGVGPVSGGGVGGAAGVKPPNNPSGKKKRK
ncbi:GTP binding protein [Rhizophlyctis rosea]|uniref:GTP binding protein n=1 Tax=Rhizophlyctis rosea TaxID=64517 RepID=A0AAD5S6C4_9FUNG|nr:GTP binding protein [Rhizophlyctis rosea]